MALADFHTIERKKTIIYRDFSNSFEKNPITGSLSMKTNEEAVKQALKNLVLTDVGERFYDHQKGSTIKRSLFEQFDPGEWEMLKLQLGTLIRTYEPRIDGLWIYLKEDIDRNAYYVQFQFTIINIIGPPVNLDVYFQRVR